MPPVCKAHVSENIFDPHIFRNKLCVNVQPYSRITFKNVDTLGLRLFAGTILAGFGNSAFCGYLF